MIKEYKIFLLNGIQRNVFACRWCVYMYLLIGDMNTQKCIIAHLGKFMIFFYKVIWKWNIHKNCRKMQYFKATKNRKKIKYIF